MGYCVALAALKFTPYMKTLKVVLYQEAYFSGASPLPVQVRGTTEASLFSTFPLPQVCWLPWRWRCHLLQDGVDRKALGVKPSDNTSYSLALCDAG